MVLFASRSASASRNDHAPISCVPGDARFGYVRTLLPECIGIMVIISESKADRTMV